MTIPSLIQDAKNRDNVARLLKFNTNLQQAIMLWKNDINCNDDAKTCLTSMGFVDDYNKAFDETIGKYLYIVDKAGSPNTKNWLPDYTLNYYDEKVTNTWGSVAHVGSSNYVYLLKDGTTLSIDFSIRLFDITVDVNGKNGPNRMGKDVFHFTVGGISGKDVRYGKFHSPHNSKGLCKWQNTNCDTDNVNPTVGNGANPTQYVIMHHEMPDYDAIAKSVSGFTP